MITYKAYGSYNEPKPTLGFGFYGSVISGDPSIPKDTVLEYTLDKLDHTLLFQINYQNPLVKEILKKGKFMASNGWIIDLSNVPELKASMNTIYLRGSNSKYNTLPDTTTFTHNFKRDNAYKLTRQAIKEFAAFVRKNASFYRVSSFRNPSGCICW